MPSTSLALSPSTSAPGLPYRPVDRSSAPTGAGEAGPPAPPPPPPTGRASHRIASHRIASHRLERLQWAETEERIRTASKAWTDAGVLPVLAGFCGQVCRARLVANGRPSAMACGRPSAMACGRPGAVACGRPSAAACGRPGAVVMSRHVTSHPALPLPLPLPLPLQTEGGRTTTLGRNGSDYTATLVRAAPRRAAQLSAAGAAQRAGIEYRE
jgi:hypothetical protein